MAIASWKILLLGKLLHCFCFSLSLALEFVIQDGPRIMDILFGRCRWESRVQSPCMSSLIAYHVF